MLVLARKRFERILITTRSGESIEVSVQRVKYGVARLGFTADREIQIDRMELVERKAATDLPVCEATAVQAR